MAIYSDRIWSVPTKIADGRTVVKDEPEWNNERKKNGDEQLQGPQCYPVWCRCQVVHTYCHNTVCKESV